MVVGRNFHPTLSVNEKNVDTKYILAITNDSGRTVLEGNVLTTKKTKSSLVARLREDDRFFDIVGDGAVEYKCKAFVFNGDKGTFFAKLVKYSA